MNIERSLYKLMKRRYSLVIVSFVTIVSMSTVITFTVLNIFSGNPIYDQVEINQPISDSSEVLGVAAEASPSANPVSSPSPSLTPTPLPSPNPSPIVTSAQLEEQSEPVTQSVILPSLDPKAGNITFNVTLADLSRTKSSDLEFQFTQTGGVDTLSGLEIKIPAGWTILAGDKVSEGVIVGSGTLVFLLDGQARQTLVTMVNAQTREGNDNLWLIKFGDINSPFVTLKSTINGDAGSGYTWVINRQFLFDIKPPMQFDLKILAEQADKPRSAGDYVFEQLTKFSDAVSNTLQKTISIF